MTLISLVVFSCSLLGLGTSLTAEFKLPSLHTTHPIQVEVVVLLSIGFHKHDLQYFSSQNTHLKSFNFLKSQKRFIMGCT